MALRVTDLSFRFGDLLVLERVSFEVGPGEFVALVGPSGCGKTTILRCISGLLPVGGGAVHVDDAPADRRTLFSFVFQRSALLPWLTVRENLTLPFRLRASEAPSAPEIQRLLDELDLGGFGDSFPAQLSVGMAQRVAFARALSEKRPYLLLDEPYSGLDELSKRALAAVLSRTAHDRGIGAILVTHSIHDAVFLADRVVVLSSRPSKVRRVVDVRIDKPRPPELWLSEVLVPYMGDARSALENAG
jgi:NitT/TauT family transport system ATP-binding protein